MGEAIVMSHIRKCTWIWLDRMTTMWNSPVVLDNKPSSNSTNCAEVRYRLSDYQPFKAYVNSWDQAVLPCIHLDTIITKPNCLKATQNCICMHRLLRSPRFHHVSIFNERQNVKFLNISICVCLHPQFAASILGRDNFSSRSRHLCNAQDQNIQIFEINAPKI